MASSEAAYFNYHQHPLTHHSHQAAGVMNSFGQSVAQQSHPAPPIATSDNGAHPPGASHTLGAFSHTHHYHHPNAAAAAAYQSQYSAYVAGLQPPSAACLADKGFEK